MASSAQQTGRGSREILQHAKELQAAGDCRAATDELEALCRIDPTYAPGWVHLSFLYLAGSDYARALAAAETAARLDPYSAAGPINAGIAARKLRDLPTARRFFEQAVCIDREDPMTQLHLGRVLAELGATTDAIDAFVRTIGLAHRAEFGYEYLIEQGVYGLAAAEPHPPLGGLLGSLQDGARWLASGKLSCAYRCLERARDGPCGLELCVSATREAAKTLLGEVWRRHALMTPTPGDAERPCAPLIYLRP